MNRKGMSLSKDLARQTIFVFGQMRKVLLILALLGAFGFVKPPVAFAASFQFLTKMTESMRSCGRAVLNLTSGEDSGEKILANLKGRLGQIETVPSSSANGSDVDNIQRTLEVLYASIDAEFVKTRGGPLLIEGMTLNSNVLNEIIKIYQNIVSRRSEVQKSEIQSAILQIEGLKASLVRSGALASTMATASTVIYALNDILLDQAGYSSLPMVTVEHRPETVRAFLEYENPKTLEKYLIAFSGSLTKALKQTDLQQEEQIAVLTILGNPYLFLRGELDINEHTKDTLIADNQYSRGYAESRLMAAQNLMQFKSSRAVTGVLLTLFESNMFLGNTSTLVYEIEHLIYTRVKMPLDLPIAAAKNFVSSQTNNRHRKEEFFAKLDEVAAKHQRILDGEEEPLTRLTSEKLGVHRIAELVMQRLRSAAQ